jgi:6-phosphogluconolactonase
MASSNISSNAKIRVESTGIQWNEASDKEALAVVLADAIAKQLQVAIDSGSQSGSKAGASLVVSGGSTPAPVFARLCESDIDWSQVKVTLADERWVPPGHADSNESLVRDTLLVKKASAAEFVSLYRDGISPEQALTEVAHDLNKMASPFTVVILGMGNDGHTASLFPDAPGAQLSGAMDLNSSESVAIMHPASVPQTRITLTRRALLNARHRILHITGEQKSQVLYDAIGDSPNNGYRDGMAPISGLLLESPESVSVFWSP